MLIVKCNFHKKNKYVMFLGLAAFNSFVHFVAYNKARLSTKYV